MITSVSDADVPARAIYDDCEQQQLIRIALTPLSFALFGPVFYLVLHFLGGFQFVAWAEESRSSDFEILGVRVNCPRCELKSNAPCRVFLPDPLHVDTNGVMDCEEALAHLLQYSATESASKDFSPPAVQELRRYLFRSSTPASGAVAALMLLGATSEGQSQIVSDLPSLLELQPVALTQWFEKNNISTVIRDAAFRLPRQKNAEMVRGLAVAGDSKRTPADLLNELPAVNTAQDREDILMYSLAFEMLRPTLDSKLRSFASLLSTCEQIQDKDFQEHCLSQSIPSELNEASRYLLRLKFSWVVQRALQSRQSLIDKLSWFSHLNFREYHSQQAIAALRTLLTQLLREPFSRQQEYLDSGRLGFLQDIAATDKEIGSLYALLLVRYAGELWDLGGRREASRALLTSYQIFPEFLEARTALVEKVSFELPREEAWFQEMWEKLPETAHAELRWTPNNTRSGILVVVGGCLLFFLLSLAYWLLRRRQAYSRQDLPDEEPRPVVSLEGVEELRVLLAYFDLRPPVAASELTRRYRQKAKVLHPDVISGNRDEFELLSERYQRAKELLARISQISGARSAAERRNDA